MGRVLSYVAFLILFTSIFKSCNGAKPECMKIQSSSSAYSHLYNLKDVATIDKGRNSITIKFSVQTARDAIFLFVGKDDPKDYLDNKEFTVEVILGAGQNTYSAIRKGTGKIIRHADTNGIVSASEPRSFWIEVIDKQVFLGKEGEILPIVSAFVPTMREPKWFDVYTFLQNTVLWTFNCLKNETNSTIEPIQKLKGDLLSKYDPLSNPGRKMIVETFLFVKHANLDVKKFSFESQVLFNLTWTDHRLVWSPSNYSGIEYMQLLYREVWIPEFILYNPLGKNSFEISNSLLIVTHEGKITWTPLVNMKTLCPVKILNWPQDNHYCHVTLGLQAYNDLFQILSLGIEDDTILTESEWRFEHMSASVNLVQVPWVEQQDDESAESPFEEMRREALVLEFHLQRKAGLYNIIYLTPALVILLSLMSLSWAPVKGFGRLQVQYFFCFIIVIILLALDSVIPFTAHERPQIVVIYSWTLYTLLLSIVVTILAKKLGSPNCILTNLVNTVLSRASSTPLVYVSISRGIYEVNKSENEDEEKELTPQVKWTLNLVSFGTALIVVLIQFIEWK